ncbi:MAG: peptidylprolyl isomerase, partial [candidate division WOR-3 bacterium]
MAFGFWLLAFGFWLSAFANIADRIVAVVGDKIILKSEVEQLVTFVRLSTGDTLTPDSILQEEARRRLIDEALLQTEAIRESVEVGRDEIATEVAKSIASLKERFESEEEFAAALGEEGLSEKMLKERIGEEVRKNLLARRLLEKKGLMQIYISPAEAEQFYNEHKDSIAFLPGRVSLAHILIPITPSESAEAEVQRRAWEVIDLLSRGGDFATLARSFSDDPKTKERGGDWGFRNEEEIPLDLGMVLTQLKPGQISPPFRTQDGYLIAK